MSIPNASPALYNEDLAPARERKWGAFSIFNVWTSDVHSLWGYYLAASLFLMVVFLALAVALRHLEKSFGPIVGMIGVASWAVSFTWKRWKPKRASFTSVGLTVRVQFTTPFWKGAPRTFPALPPRCRPGSAAGSRPGATLTSHASVSGA